MPGAPLEPGKPSTPAEPEAPAPTEPGVPSTPGEPKEPDAPTEPGATIDSVEVRSQALTEIRAELDDVKNWSAEDLTSAYAVTFAPNATTDLSTLTHYDVLQASRLALDAQEAELLGKNGFVITERLGAPTFSYAYNTIYAEDVPVFVSADSVLDAVHRSYDDILVDMEREVMIPALQRYLQGVRANLAREDIPESVRKDVDFFLAVPQSLFVGSAVAPAFAGSFDPAELAEFVDAAENAQGEQARELFGFLRRIDFSQFKPRGHYTLSPELERYFKAMMWLGRTDLRFLETDENTGERILRRRQVEAAFGFRDLMGPEQRNDWDLIDRIVTAFVGEHDYMTLREIDKLQADLGITSTAELAGVSDEVLTRAILDGKYGEQRIASQIIRGGGIFEPFPLSASFALFGQRYAIDSHVFSEVVYDRTKIRVVPNPLDAAFAAFGNDHAASLLKSELEEWKYAPSLGGIRKLADREPESAWQSSLYTLWLGALRELSAQGAPAGTQAATSLAPAPATPGSGLPGVAKTEPWARRLLNTQLASWAQLRHDTLLYVKQSYTGAPACEYPDAYVDPYPEFWARLLLYAERGTELLASLDRSSPTLTRAATYFERFTQIVSVLERMARHQLTGAAHTAEDIAFINDAIRISSGGSGPPSIQGWYHQLLYHPEEFGDEDRLVADVHTDPGGELPIPRGPTVLHVGTGYPRLMVVAVDTCSGKRAYAGPVFAYHEYLAPGLTRLTDEEWRTKLTGPTPPENPPWLAPLLAE